MKIFAISDLHLSAAVKKPMDIFGDGWQNHWEKISEDWRARVGEEDLVLLGGDISWGINLEEAAPDYAAVAALPGRKLVLRGNHDYYWSSLSKMRAAFPEFSFLQNECLRFGRALIAGSRGWTLPDAETSPEDKKIYERELIRLELSLKDMEKQRREGDAVFAMLHYPPFNAAYADSEATAMLESYGVEKVVYGHLHGKNVRIKPKVVKNSVEYYLTSCDLVGNRLIFLAEI